MSSPKRSPTRAIANVLAARDSEQLVALISSQAAELAAADRARVLVAREDAYAVLAASDGSGEGAVVAEAADPCCLAIKLGEPVLWQRSNEESPAIEFASALAVPLTVHGQPTMAVACYREAAFTPAERDALAGFLEAVPPFWEHLIADEANEAELKQAEFKVAQLRERVDASEKLKAQFVATMSHELRTPLNVILGFGSLLADEAFGPLNDDQDDACEKIMESTERLAMLINDLLDFSRLQASTLEFHFGPVEVPAMVESALDALAPLAERKALAIELDFEDELPRIRGDMQRLEQTIKHLLDNAIKFTAEGGRIGVRARREEDEVVIEVWDTGIGIPSEAMHRLFDRFYQVDSTNTRLYGGTGIGLALVKELVERHGGQVNVESRIGKGSTFRITLPIAGVSGAVRR